MDLLSTPVRSFAVFSFLLQSRLKRLSPSCKVQVHSAESKPILQSPRLVHLSSVKDSLMERCMSEAATANEIHSPSHIKSQPVTNWLLCVTSKREVAKADKGRPKQTREADTSLAEEVDTGESSWEGCFHRDRNSQSSLPSHLDPQHLSQSLSGDNRLTMWAVPLYIF